MERHLIKIGWLIPEKGTRRNKAPFRGMTGKDISEHNFAVKMMLAFEESLEQAHIVIPADKKKEVYRLHIRSWRLIKKLEKKYGNLMRGGMHLLTSDSDVKVLTELQRKIVLILGKEKTKELLDCVETMNTELNRYLREKLMKGI